MSNDVVDALVKRSEGGLRRDARLISTREKAIVNLVVQGYRNNDIAERLFINEPTVIDDLNSIFDKLAVSDRLDLALYAIHDRLMDQSGPQVPADHLSGSSLGCWMRGALVRLRKRHRKI